MPFPPDTILLLHPPRCDPYAFLSRLLENPVDEDELVIPWTIDNKYYTAQVNIHVLELDDQGVIPAGAEVLLYLFDQVTTIPYALTQSMASEPKDIALAVRVKDVGTGEGDGEDFHQTPTGSEEWQDMLEELGMEVVDETAQPADDDERPISPIETIRQTLMTHLWAGMQRKPLDNGRTANPLPAHRDPAADDADDQDDEVGPSTFPVSFNPPEGKAAESVKGEEQSGTADAVSAFPDLAELRQQIEMDEFDRFERTGELAGGALGRLDMLDELLGATPGDEEYARLDEWLDEDDENGNDGFAPLEAGEADGEGSDKEHSVSRGGPTGHTENASRRGKEWQPAEAGNETFDDDFDDFAAFQSAPRVGGGSKARDTALTMDPTPLLYHLQSVRTELAGLSEEERRTRAAKEVARVMRDLGFEDADGDLFADEDGDDAELRV